MNKKFFITAIALLGMAFNVNAQFNLGKLASDALIEKSLNGSMVIVEQKYQLKEVKTGDLYGRGGNDEFGTAYGIGVMTKDGIVLTEELIRPWVYDEDYKPYSENKSYEPVLFKTSIKTAAQTEFTSIETNVNGIKEIDEPYFLMPKSNGKIGLPISDTTGTLDGWLVWASIPVGEELGVSSSLKLIVTSKKQVELKKNEFRIDAPQSLDKILFGLFTVPRVTQTGCISFEICGVIYKNESEWMCVPVKPSWRAEKANGNTNVEAKGDKKADKGDKGNELTPSGGNGKNKKGNK